MSCPSANSNRGKHDCELRTGARWRRERILDSFLLRIGFQTMLRAALHRGSELFPSQRFLFRSEKRNISATCMRAWPTTGLRRSKPSKRNWPKRRPLLTSSNTGSMRPRKRLATTPAGPVSSGCWPLWIARPLNPVSRDPSLPPGQREHPPGPCFPGPGGQPFTGGVTAAGT